MGLIGDLFPALDVPRKRNIDFEKMIKKTALDMKLQPEEGFTLKIVQLDELFAVRHSVFIIGNAGKKIIENITFWEITRIFLFECHCRLRWSSGKIAAYNS